MTEKEKRLASLAEFERNERMMINTLGVGDVQFFDSDGNLVPQEIKTAFEVCIEKGIPLPEGVNVTFWQERIARRQAAAEAKAALAKEGKPDVQPPRVTPARKKR